MAATVPDADEGALELPFTRRSAVVARRVLGQLVRVQGATGQGVHDVSIVAHELVANAVDHGRADDAGALRVSWRFEPGTVRITVRDAGTTGTIAVAAAPFDGPRGRGLHMVQSVSEEWGTERYDAGTRVWARVALGTDGALATDAGDLFAAAGSLRGLYEATDWSRTSFGPPERWSVTLRATVRMVLNTRFACTLLWGPDHALLYNEAYLAIIGDKHPAAVGAPARVVFPEAWSLIGPWMEQVGARLEPFWSEEEWVPLERDGYLEDCWFTFCYSPVPDAHGDVEGILDIAVEVTSEVVARRRLDALARLRSALAESAPLATAQEVRAAVLHDAAAVLRDFPRDLPDVELRATLSGRTPGSPLPQAPGAGRLSGTDLLVEADPNRVPVRRVAWLPLPTARTAADPAVLVSGLGSGQDGPDTHDFLRLVGDTVRQALDRAEHRFAEQVAVQSDRRFSRDLQRSLLGASATRAGIELAARYVPATLVDAIGGDWHDSFLDRHGDLVLVVGDVAGHDRAAALAMGQARNLLRGTLMALDEPVGRALQVFDETLSALDVGVHLTAVLARLCQDPAGGGWELSWAAGGHAPPVLLAPDGTASLLRDGHGPMLGLDLADARDEGSLALAPGSTLVLYTDGLVERPGEHLEVSFAALLRVVAQGAGDSCAALADRLLAHAGAHRDDVALVVARV